ncbi:MAG: hypothetical protein ABIJ12_10265 [bacterium]
MKRIIFLAVSIMMIGSNANAANLAMITSTPTMLDILILICSIGCVMGAMKVLSLVRGGQFSKSWQYLMGGFSALIVVQLLRIFNAIEIIMLPVFVIPTCFILMMGLFLYGIYEAKRILS